MIYKFNVPKHSASRVTYRKYASTVVHILSVKYLPRIVTAFCCRLTKSILD